MVFIIHGAVAIAAVVAAWKSRNKITVSGGAEYVVVLGLTFFALAWRFGPAIAAATTVFAVALALGAPHALRKKLRGRGADPLAYVDPNLSQPVGVRRPRGSLGYLPPVNQPQQQQHETFTR